MSLSQTLGGIERKARTKTRTQIETQLKCVNCKNWTELKEEINLPIEIIKRTKCTD